jgi:hypothetical protein
MRDVKLQTETVTETICGLPHWSRLTIVYPCYERDLLTVHAEGRGTLTGITKQPQLRF